MAQAILVEKPVVFSGIWMPHQSIDDHFLRKVSNEFEGKPGAKKAIWRLTKEGVTIIVTQSQTGRPWQTDVIAVQAIKEVTVNRYNPLCLMTVYVDQQRRFNALVCACRSREDAGHIVQVYRQLQRSLSGEGFQLDLKHPKGMNWTLKTKHGGDGEGHNGHALDGILVNNNNNNTVYSSQDGEGEVVVIVEADEEELDRESLQVDGRPCYNVGVQAELGGPGEGWADEESDRESTTSDASYQSLKDELLALSNEVRDIKLLLRQTTGISAEEYFRRQRRDGDDPGSPWTLHPVPVKRTRSSDTSEGCEKRVNFAGLGPGGEGSAGAASGAGLDGTDGNGGGDEEGDGEDFDIRSVGMQTITSRGGVGADGSRIAGYRMYTKRVHHNHHHHHHGGAATLPSRYQPSAWRHRSVSSSSATSASPSPLSPHAQSPFSPNSGSVFTYQHQQRHLHHHQGHRETRSATYRPPPSPSPSGGGGGGSVFSSSGTVVRPIESVYHVQKVKPGSSTAQAPRSVRRKHQVMVIVPRDAALQQRSASLPRQRTASVEAAATATATATPPPGSRGGSLAERRGPGNSNKLARPQLPTTTTAAAAAVHTQRSSDGGGGGGGGDVQNGVSSHSEAALAAVAAAVVQIHEGPRVEAQNGGS